MRHGGMEHFCTGKMTPEMLRNLEKISQDMDKKRAEYEERQELIKQGEDQQAKLSFYND